MRLCVVLAALIAAGCGDDTSKPAMDLSSASTDMTVYSVCAHPGDTGNSKGVGKFCTDSNMCAGQAAIICSTVMPIPQGPTDFCTLPCNPNDANPNAPCGENASCTCLDANNPSLCGCVPDRCRLGLFG
jgi:hypothetical protein